MDTVQNRNFWNEVRYDQTSNKGHYESYFFRANHPTKPLAFWIRYTIFSPKGARENSIGELWSIFFNGETNTVSAAKSEHPISECSFSKSSLDVDIAGSKASWGKLSGNIRQPNRLDWKLSYDSSEKPLLLLPENLYEAPLPKAKAVVGAPLATFNGVFNVNDESYVIENWIGSENHNWGEKHTDQYAWGQVSGFDEHPNVFLEGITGKVKVGPFLSPLFTVLVLRVDGEDFKFNTVGNAFRAKANYQFFEWHFKCKNKGAELEGVIKAPREHFVGLTYYNPPGGSNTCLNCKIASCEITFKRKGKETLSLSSKNKAAFEILTDRSDHQVPVAT